MAELSHVCDRVIVNEPRPSALGLSPQMVARVLDAADRCIVGLGLEATSMTAVANEAGVSRQSVHRLFHTRDQMLEALGLRQIHRRLDVVIPKAARRRTAQARLEAFVLEWASTGDVVATRLPSFKDPDIQVRALILMLRSPEYVPLLGGHLRKLVHGAPGEEQLRHPDDWEGMALMVLQHTSLRRIRAHPSTKPTELAFVRRYLIPALFHTEERP